METIDKPIIAYKAFDKDMKCRGYQYEVGKEYEMDGNIKCCERGFHACESPLEIWTHYDMLTSRFAEVEQAGCKSKAKAKAGSWITLAEWEWSDTKKRYVPKCVKTEFVDGERIKADTWYQLTDGEFREVKP